MRKWAYMGIPHTGGTYSVFKNLREGLLRHDVDLRWVACGAACSERLADGEYASELPLGTVVVPTESDDKKQGTALVQFFEHREYEGIFVNVFSGKVSTNFVRYLKSEIPRILIVHSVTVATYAAARAIRDYVHAAVGVSPRIVADLIGWKNFDSRWTVSISNAVQVERFSRIRIAAAVDTRRVLFLGRVEDGAKGCFLLPRIISHVRDKGVRVEWQIAGDGPDLAELRRRCGVFPNVGFLGRVPYEKVPEVCAQADIYLFPSRYEGFPLSLVEAMAGGCVPVASLIRGVTDSIVEHSKTGYLFPIGNWRRAAEYVIQLACEPERMRSMSAAAREIIGGRFFLSAIAQQYAHLMDRVLADPRLLKPPLDLRKWSYPRGLKAGLRTYLPDSLKSWLRTMRELMHGRVHAYENEFPILREVMDAAVGEDDK